jgi:hypothetical protein
MNKKRTIYFVEGLPGTGKTTTSNWLHNKLDARLFTENAADYPNDFSEIAGMTIEVHNEISKQFPILKEFSFEYGSIKYVNTRHLKSQFPNELELIQSLTLWDFGDEFNTHVSVPHYITCSLGLLNRWVEETIKNTNESYIMDSVWLQNPINELLFRNADEKSILEYCTLLAKIFSEFELICIYLNRSDAAKSVEFASEAKGSSWTNRVIELISSTPYGLAHKLTGMEGMIQYFSARQKIEENILSHGIIKHKEYNADSNNWEQIREYIRNDFIKGDINAID